VIGENLHIAAEWLVPDCPRGEGGGMKAESGKAEGGGMNDEGAG